jgi:hypothetical protein
MHARAYRHGNPSSDLGWPSETRGVPWCQPCPWPSLTVPGLTLAVVVPLSYLSPRLTKIDPDGFSTRTHSAVHPTSAATHSAGVASEPICPS